MTGLRVEETILDCSKVHEYEGRPLEALSAEELQQLHNFYIRWASISLELINQHEVIGEHIASTANMIMFSSSPSTRYFVQPSNITEPTTAFFNEHGYVLSYSNEYGMLVANMEISDNISSKHLSISSDGNIVIRQ